MFSATSKLVFVLAHSKIVCGRFYVLVSPNVLDVKTV